MTHSLKFHHLALLLALVLHYGDSAAFQMRHPTKRSLVWNCGCVSLIRHDQWHVSGGSLISLLLINPQLSSLSLLSCYLLIKLLALTWLLLMFLFLMLREDHLARVVSAQINPQWITWITEISRIGHTLKILKYLTENTFDLVTLELILSAGCSDKILFDGPSSSNVFHQVTSPITRDHTLYQWTLLNRFCTFYHQPSYQAVNQQHILLLEGHIAFRFH